jgi:hypothetical protein
MVIILPDPAEKDLRVAPEQQPDLVIHSLWDLLDHFPPRNGHQE